MFLRYQEFSCDESLGEADLFAFDFNYESSALSGRKEDWLKIQKLNVYSVAWRYSSAETEVE